MVPPNSSMACMCTDESSIAKGDTDESGAGDGDSSAAATSDASAFELEMHALQSITMNRGKRFRSVSGVGWGPSSLRQSVASLTPIPAR